MWEAIKEILTSSNAVSVLLFLAVCIIGAFVLVKTGMLQIHTEAVRVGAADDERTIIRHQLDYVKHHLRGIERKLPKPDNYNEYLGRFIVEVVYDEYVNWITFNHISRSEKYISVKQNQIVDIISQYTIKDEFKTDEFFDFVRKDTKETILELINIREIYRNNERSMI